MVANLDEGSLDALLDLGEKALLPGDDDGTGEAIVCLPGSGSGSLMGS
jgi:hypothetical protein